MNRSITAAFASALALAFASPALAQTSAASAYTIDVLLPTTGPAAFVGNAEAQAVKIYQGVINKSGGIHGQPVQFEFHDDQGSPIQDVQIVNALLAKHPAVILGPPSILGCQAVGAVVKDNGPVLYCYSPGVTPVRDSYVFTSSATLREKIFSALDALRVLGYKKIALLTEMDETGRENQRYAHEYFAAPPAHGLALVSDEVQNPSDVTVAAQLAKIQASSPDVVMLWSSGAAFGTALRDIQNTGLSTVVATSPLNANPVQIAQYKSFLPKVLVLQGAPYQGPMRDSRLQAAATEYLTAMKEAGVAPASIHAYAWDPTRIVVSALRALPKNATAADLRTYLEGLHGFAGLFGIYDFRNGDQHGLNGVGDPYVRFDADKQDWVYFTDGPARAL